MNSNAEGPNEERIEESSTPVTSPPTAAEASSLTGSIQTNNPQSGSVKMAAANFNIPPPAKFDPKTDDWDHWIKRYELFEAATERDELSDKVRINTLIYVMGNNAADIYDSFKLIGEDILYVNVKQKFKDHFKGKVCLVFERTQFVRRFQQDKESVLTFIEDLQKRADLCSFGDLRDQMVHTQIIAGLRDSHLRRRLMANDNLTLDQVIKEVKSVEITKHQAQILQKTTQVPPTYRKYMTGKFQKTNVEVQNPSILEVLRKRSKNRVTDAELSQVTLLSVAQPKMLPAMHATKRVIIPRSVNLQNESIELAKIRTKMISL